MALGMRRPGVDGVVRVAKAAVLTAALGLAAGARGDSFHEGERLKFEARWGLVMAAELTLEAVERGEHEGAACWRFAGTARSRGPVEMMYRVRSRIESKARPEDFDAWEYLEDRNEGGTRYHRLTVLDFQAGTGRWVNYESGNTKKLKLTGPACDLLSICYRVRGVPWRVGERRNFRVFADGKYHEIHIEAASRAVKRVGVWAEQPVIRIVCNDVFEPAKNTTGRLEVWLTDDARHLPLLGRLKVSWGTVEIALVEAVGIVGPPLRRNSEKRRR